MANFVKIYHLVGARTAYSV